MRAAVWRVLTHDVPLKLVALVISIALFVVVRSDKESATGVLVRVIYTLPTDRVLVSDPVSEVKLAIRGPWTKIQNLDERELEPIRIDLSRSKETVLHFSESMVSLPYGLRVVSMMPTQTKLVFEPRAERNVPVQPLLEGQPRDGFRVSPSTLQLVLDGRLEDGRPPALYKKRIDVTGLPSGVSAEVRPDTALLSTRHRRE